jgi:hypothetical protein
VRIKTLRPFYVRCTMIRWVETPSTPSFIGEGGGGVGLQGRSESVIVVLN